MALTLLFQKIAKSSVTLLKKEQLKQPFGETSASIFNQFTFMAKSRTNGHFYDFNKCVHH